MNAPCCFLCLEGLTRLDSQAASVIPHVPGRRRLVLEPGQSKTAPWDSLLQHLRSFKVYGQHAGLLTQPLVQLAAPLLPQPGFRLCEMPLDALSNSPQVRVPYVQLTVLLLASPSLARDTLAPCLPVAVLTGHLLHLLPGVPGPHPSRAAGAGAADRGGLGRRAPGSGG